MDSFLRGLSSSFMEVGLAMGSGGLLNHIFMEVDKDDEDTGILVIRLLAHSAANAVVLTQLSRLGLARFETPTGLAIFSVLFILSQSKFCHRFLSLQTKLLKLLSFPSSLPLLSSSSPPEETTSAPPAGDQ